MHARHAWIIMAIAVIALVSGLWYMNAASPSRDRDTAATQPPGEPVVGTAKDNADKFDVTITYTNDGFSPRDITIPQGTRVRFLNASSEETWPASGVHPTHTLYPEKESTDCLGSSFDACRALKPGEFFDFTFYYVGDWPFHDHDHAYHSGSITVTASSTLR